MEIQHTFYGNTSLTENPVWMWMFTIQHNGQTFEGCIERRHAIVDGRSTYYVLAAITDSIGNIFSLGYTNLHATAKYLFRTMLRVINGQGVVAYQNGHVECDLPLPQEMCAEDLEAYARISTMCPPNPSSGHPIYNFQQRCALEFHRRKNRK